MPKNLTKKWKPVTSLSQKFILQFSEPILRKSKLSMTSALGEGRSGIILSLWYLYKQTGDVRVAHSITTYVECLLKDLESPSYREWFYGGFSGIGYVLSHLKNEKAIPSHQLEPILAKIDHLLINELNNNIEKSSIEIHYGLIGQGLYLLERNNSVTRKALKMIINEIERKAVKQGKFITWPDYSGMAIRNARRPEYSFGYHYGIAGICSFLMMCYRAGFSKGKSKRMIISSLNWCFNQTFALTDSCFPDEWTERLSTTTSRISWRSSDMPMSIVFYQAYLLFGIEKFQVRSKMILDLALNRKLIESGILFDKNKLNAGLTYGASGTAMMMMYYYNLSGYLPAKNAAKYWVEIVRKFSNKPNYYNPYQLKWKREINFCNGSSGQLLTFLAASGDNRPEWINSILLIP